MRSLEGGLLPDILEKAALGTRARWQTGALPTTRYQENRDEAASRAFQIVSGSFIGVLDRADINAERASTCSSSLNWLRDRSLPSAITAAWRARRIWLYSHHTHYHPASAGFSWKWREVVGDVIARTSLALTHLA